MTVYVSDLFTATPAPVNASPASTRTWQWLRGSSAISGATSATYTAVTADIGSTLSATQLETNFLATTTATSAATEVIQAFDPIRLFSASEPGVWYDPTDMSTLYQNAAGTIPVTSFGQPVGLMLDKSRGLVLGPELVVNGTFDTDVTGWTAGGGASLSSVGGKLRVTSNGSLSYAQLSFTTEVNKSYTLVMEAYKATSTNYLVNLGSTVGGNNYVNRSLPDGQFSITFLATTTTATFRLYPQTASDKYSEFDNISVKELPGLHATQSTEASRPLYGIVPVSGRRNLLVWSEDYSNAVWNKTGVVPSGSTITALSGSSAHRILQSTSVAPVAPCTFHIEVTAGTHSFVQMYNGASTTYLANFDLSSGVVGSLGTRTTATIVNLGSGRYRCSATFDNTGTPNSSFSVGMSSSASAAWGETWTAAGTETITLHTTQLETGSTPTAYQRVSTDLDVTEAGVASVGYLRFDGSTSWMVTPTITPGTDKAQVFAGVRKNSDALESMILEFSVNSNTNNGSFQILGPDSNATSTYRFYARGDTANTGYVPTGYAAPVTNVIASLMDLAGADRTTEVIPRINGVLAQVGAAGSGSAGGGNFLAYPLYIGRRAGTSLPLNGHLFPLIVRFGPTLTAARIAATEAWVATKTAGVVLP